MDHSHKKTLFRRQRYLQSSVTSALRQDLRLPTETLKNSSSHQLPTAACGAELTLLLLLSGGSLLAPPRTCSTALMEVEEGDPLVFSHWCIANCSHICIRYDMSHCTVKSAFKWDLKTGGIKTSLTFIKSAQQTGVALFLLLVLFVFPTTDQSNTMWCWRQHHFATWASSPDFWQPAALTVRPFQRLSLLQCHGLNPGVTPRHTGGVISGTQGGGAIDSHLLCGDTTCSVTFGGICPSREGQCNPTWLQESQWPGD